MAPHPLVWSAGGLPKRRRIVDIVRDVALVPGPLYLLGSDWISVPPVVVTAADICLWPYSVDFLIKLVAFLSSLHWPSDGGDLGPGGISYVELQNLYELWAGERFQFEKAVPRCKRVDRPISVSAVPFGPGIDNRRSCWLLGAMLRALCILPGGLGRFLGANHSRLRHIGWVQSGHGLTSRPRETSDVRFLDELLFLFGYPPGSGCALVRGTLPLRYCTSWFAHKLPTWSLPVSGGVMMVVCWCVLILPVLILEGSEIGLGFLDLGLREFDLGENTPFMRFFREFLGIILGHGFGRD